jgi:hypothetical protein
MPNLHAPAERPFQRLRAAFAARLSGPGGLYNFGNALGLVGGLALAAAAADGPDLGDGAKAAWAHLFGGADAVCVTLAMAIFFWSGERYRAAWSHGAPPDPRLNRLGDLSSGLGALVLGVGLALMGEPLLALTAGLLHAIGKFGSAAQTAEAPRRFAGLPDAFRVAVLASRGPALTVAGLDLARTLAGPGPLAPSAVAAPALLIACYLVWARADLQLLRG